LAKEKRGVSDKCQCCGGIAREDLMHFLTGCPALQQVRQDWVYYVHAQAPESTVTLSDVPKLVLGPADKLQALPFETTGKKVAVVEKLLVSLWHTRNALHFGSQDGVRTAPESPPGRTRPAPNGARRTDAALDSRRSKQSATPVANGRPTRTTTRCGTGAQIATRCSEPPTGAGSTDGPKTRSRVTKTPLNATNEGGAIATCAQPSPSVPQGADSVDGPLTRSRARLLRQSVDSLASGPCQRDVHEADDAPRVHTPALRVRTPAHRVQTSRSQRLESMEIISKT
jgi:hypothetical protein